MSSSVISPTNVSRSTPIWARNSSVIRLSAVTAVVLSARSGEGGDVRQLAADDQLLDLRGALVQSQRDRVAVIDHSTIYLHRRSQRRTNEDSSIHRSEHSYASNRRSHNYSCPGDMSDPCTDDGCSD